MLLLAVNVTLPPVQKVVEPLAEMVAVGRGFTIAVTGEEFNVQPELPITLTV